MAIPLGKFRSGLNWLRETLFGRIFRARFRYDVFISYSHSEKPYAANLKKQLNSLDYSCFFDEEESPPGSSLDPTLDKALRKSAVLVLLATERALSRPYIISEFEKFAATGRTIIPINLLGTLSKNNEQALAKAPWNTITDRKIVWIDETDEAFNKHNPSPAIADGIDKLFKYTRRNVRVRADSDDLIKSTSIATRSLRMHPTLAGDIAIRKNLSLLPSLTKGTPYDATPTAAAMSPNATAVGFLNANSEVEIRRPGKEVVRKSTPKATP